MRFSIDFSKAFVVYLWYSFPIWGAIVVIISLIGLLIAHLEEELSVRDALYFSWVTATTVGYGDLTPTLGSTRILAIVIALLGIVLTGIIVAMAIQAAILAVENNSSLQAFKKAAEESTQRRIEKNRRKNK